MKSVKDNNIEQMLLEKLANRELENIVRQNNQMQTLWDTVLSYKQGQSL